MITVFYDGKCGLCHREIEYYKKIAPAGQFDWQDITLDKSTIEKLGVNYTDGLRLLHAQDAQGGMHVGVDAFLLIWQQLKQWRILAKIVATPFIKPIINAAYYLFATWRFNRLSHCQIALKAAAKK